MNTLKVDPEQIEKVRKQYENTPLWLKIITRNYLQNSNAIEVFNELLEIENMKELRKKAKSIFRELFVVPIGTPLKTITDRYGNKVVITMSSYNEIKQHSADRRVLDIVPSISELFENAVLLDRDELTKTNKGKEENTKSFWYYAVKANINKIPCYVRIIIREYINGTRFYDHDVTTAEEIEKGVNSSQPITKMGIEEKSPFAKHSLAEWWYSVNEKVFPLDPDTGEPAL